MTAPNMAAITASLERSLENCSLNHRNQNQNQSRGFLTGTGEKSRASSSDDITAVPSMEEGQNRNLLISDDTTLELNSHLSLPYHWEQCLDLKTGEIYYINWKNGMKVKEDPRITITTTATASTDGEDDEYNIDGELYSEEEDEDSSYESEESSSEYSTQPSCSRQQQEQEEEQNYRQHTKNSKEEQVLVVAGCKSCLMYFMVPKQVEDCLKCNGQLLHFDRSDNSSP